MLPRINVNSKNLYAIGLGIQSHFGILQKNIEKYKKESSFWVYDKTKLDLAYFLANSPQQFNKITYITHQNFDTIQMTKKTTFKKIYKNDKISDILENYQLKIQQSFSDIHPLSSYVLICRYMNVQIDQQIKKLFSLSFSAHQIEINNLFMPIMNEIRNKYLSDKGLKLRVLDRKCSATLEQYLENINKWRQHYQIDKIIDKKVYQGNKQDQITKKQWISENKYGWEIDSKYIFEGFGRKFSSFAYI